MNPYVDALLRSYQEKHPLSKNHIRVAIVLLVFVVVLWAFFHTRRGR